MSHIARMNESCHAFSVCIVSVCIGSMCVVSVCIGSVCMVSVCIGSVCVVSVCIGSVCVVSVCIGSPSFIPTIHTINVWHDLFVRVIWPIYMCDMTHSFKHVVYVLVSPFGDPLSHVWMSHITRLNESCHTYEWITSRIWMSHSAHMNQSWHTCMSNHLSHVRMSHSTHVNKS